MIRSVELLPAAWEGLLKIKHHVEETFDEETAERVANTILDSLERLQSFPDSGSLTPDPWLNSLGYRMVISDRRNVSIYKRIGDIIYIYLIADTRTDYTRVFRDMIVHDPGPLLQEQDYEPDSYIGEGNGRLRRTREMYCEKCSRVVDADRCPVCNNRKLREPEAKDPCYLTELDYGGWNGGFVTKDFLIEGLRMLAAKLDATAGERKKEKASEEPGKTDTITEGGNEDEGVSGQKD